MNIKPSVYESLTPRQRVIATIEAEARGDDDEVLRLRDTCPKYTYRQTDVEYTHAMVRLIALSLAVESDIREQIIGVLLSAIMGRDDTLNKFLQNIANIRAAWHTVLKEMMLDPAAMKKFSPPQHCSADILHNLLPEPDENAMREIVGEVREFLRVCN